MSVPTVTPSQLIAKASADSATVLRVRVLEGGPILTVDRTVFEMWLGSL